VDLALSLLLFELGVRVDLHWFRANPWVIVGSLAEPGFVFAGTFVMLRMLDASAGLAAAVALVVVRLLCKGFGVALLAPVSGLPESARRCRLTAE
jgi:hypothetical protein